MVIAVLLYVKLQTSFDSFDYSTGGRMKTTEPQDEEAQAAVSQQHDDTACMHKLLEVCIL